MDFPLLPFAAFTLVTVFTPGPNNITSMGYGVKYGYRRTLKFLIGVCIGVFLAFLAVSLLLDLVHKSIPKIFPFLKYAGAAYILFLAFQIIRSSGIKTKQNQSEGKNEARLYQGVLLQLLNPKGLVYNMTVLTIFIQPYFERLTPRLLFAAGLMGLVFASVSLYTLGGNVIQLLVRKAVVYRIINIVLGLALVYSAVAILLTDLELKVAV